MRNQGYCSKERLALMDETFRRMEQEEREWKKVVAPTMEEMAEHYGRLLDLIQPLNELNAKIEAEIRQQQTPPVVGHGI